LDTAAHRSIVEEKGFKDAAMSSMATSLTDRLLSTLEPLFDSQLKNKTIKKLRASLDPLIGLAIEIRCSTLVGNERYESIWPCVGAVFDASEMESASGSKNAVSHVRLPICPGLRAYPTEGPVVSYQGLGTNNEPHAPVKYVLKAMVLG
jgi:hypothetical protein